MSADAGRIAREAALAGGAVLRERRDDMGAVRSKSSATDLVTETDIASGVAVVRAILSHEPDARIVVEEPEVHEITGIPRVSPEDGRVWIIDPLDGTTSFVHGYPCYSVSVGLAENGSSIAGAVYNVPLDQMAWATAGGGAFIGDTPLRVSSRTRVDESLIVTGFPYDRTRPLDIQLNVLEAFLRNPVHGIRRDGSAAIDCCHVAAGRCDGFWEFGLKPWDMAAGALICSEAGALVTGVLGEPWSVMSGSICVANPTLHAEMQSIIQAVAASS